MIITLSKISQKSNVDFVMGYTLNLCKIHISVVPYNQNIRKKRKSIWHRTGFELRMLQIH